MQNGMKKKTIMSMIPLLRKNKLMNFKNPILPFNFVYACVHMMCVFDACMKSKLIFYHSKVLYTYIHVCTAIFL